MKSDDRSAESQLAEAFEAACGALRDAGASYALIGAFAVACHGLPRSTHDVDFLLAVPRISLPGLFEKLQRRGFVFDLLEVIKDMGKDHVASVRHGGVRVDLIDAVLPVFRRAVDRAMDLKIRGQPVRVVTPEDLIILKWLASRPSDLEDIRGIAAAKRGTLDIDYLRRSVAENCDDARCRDFERILEP